MGCVPSKAPKTVAPVLTPACVLILGAAGSGKSTFSKQLRLLHGVTLTEDEITLFRTAFVANIFLAVYDLVKYAEKQGVQVATAALRKYFIGLDPYAEPFTAQTAEQIREVLSDETIRKMRKRMPRNPYLEVLTYAEDKLETINSRDWVPSTEDVLHARCTTSGVSITKFNSETEAWTFIDVGGQPGQRKKWSSAVPPDTELSSAFFFVAADEYDVPSEENPQKTKIETSLKIWEEVMQPGGITATVPIILFLNRIDVLQQKLAEDKCQSFKEAFPEFAPEEDREDIDVALDVIKRRFLDKTSANHKQSIYVLKTCVLNTEQIKELFPTLRNNILRDSPK